MTDTINPAANPTTSGITAHDGYFTIDGQQVTLMGALSILMSDRIDNVNTSISGYLSEMESQNREAKQCNEWLADLRSLRPEKQGGTVRVDTVYDKSRLSYAGMHNKFVAKYGYEPEDKFGTRQFMDDKGDYRDQKWTHQLTQSDMDQMIEIVKSHQSSLSSSQQMVQLQLEKMSHALTEAQELLASLEKLSFDTSQNVINKI